MADPEKMAMAARRAEGQRTHEVCRPPQWVSDSLTVWIWVQQVQGAGGGGFSTCRASDPMQTVLV